MSESIWKKPISVDILNAFGDRPETGEGTMVRALGIEFTEVGDDFLRATMPVDARTHQPLGLLHGGASAALIETMGSMAATWCAGEDQYCVGIEINANHIRSKRSGIVTGTIRPVHRGGRIQVWNGELHDEHGHLICTGRLTLAVMERRSNDGN